MDFPSNVLTGPWKPRKSLAQLVALAGGASPDVVLARKSVDPSLLQSLAGKLECFSSLAASLADECRSLQRAADATALETVARVLEDRSAGIALDLGLFDE